MLIEPRLQPVGEICDDERQGKPVPKEPHHITATIDQKKERLRLLTQIFPFPLSVDHNAQAGTQGVPADSVGDLIIPLEQWLRSTIILK
jgi:hypothetical protein